MRSFGLLREPFFCGLVVLIPPTPSSSPPQSAGDTHTSSCIAVPTWLIFEAETMLASHWRACPVQTPSDERKTFPTVTEQRRHTMVLLNASYVERCQSMGTPLISNINACGRLGKRNRQCHPKTDRKVYYKTTTNGGKR